jgi:hypothetical protein
VGQRAANALAGEWRHGKTAILPLLAVLLPLALARWRECGMSATLVNRHAARCQMRSAPMLY